MQEEAGQKSVRAYLDGLVWDQVPRIERWLIDCAGAADTESVRFPSRAMLVGAVRRAVRRARRPGCKLDEMLVLEASQGAGVSRALRVLAVEDDWIGDVPASLVARSARQAELTAGKWIVEMCLDGLSYGRVATLKAYLSENLDAVRKPYQRAPSWIPRQFVIVGTTNETDGYLWDATGNRRFWPVPIQRFDLERLRADRDQLWAEAAAVEAAEEPRAWAEVWRS
jgi:predicted P-loop ATPase